MSSKIRQDGFTLIELVVVIVVLGILAAAAIPKYVSLQKEARVAQLDAMEGSMKAAAAMIHSKALTANPPVNLQATNQSLTVNSDGITAVQVDYGYPDDLAAGIDVALDFNSADWTVTAVAGTRQFVFKQINNCHVRYAAPTAAGSRPTITKVITGC